MSNALRATILALVAVAFFAAQHPLSTLLGRQNSGYLVGLANLCLAASIISFIGGVATLLLNRKLFPAYVNVFRDTKMYSVLLGTTVLSIASTSAYAYGISYFDFAIVSLLLNTLPLWGALVDRFMAETDEARTLPKYFILSTSVSIVLIGWAFWSNQSKPASEFISDLWKAAIVILVPICYVGAFATRARWMKGVDTTAAVLASMTLSMPTLALLALIVIFIKGGQVGLNFDSYLAPILYVIGTLCVTIGGFAYQKAIKFSGRGTAYPSLFNVLIPSLSALIGWTLFLATARPELSPNRYQVAAAALIIPLLLVVVWQKNAAKLKPEP
jgi:hypothetical protein